MPRDAIGFTFFISTPILNALGIVVAAQRIVNGHYQLAGNGWEFGQKRVAHSFNLCDSCKFIGIANGKLNLTIIIFNL